MNFRLMHFIAALGILAVAADTAAICIPTTVGGVKAPLIAGTGELDIVSGSTTVNGLPISGTDKTSLLVTAATSPSNAGPLPALSPASFPAVGSGTLNASGSSPYTVVAGSYGKINSNGRSLFFSGGTYYIDELNADDPVRFAPGTYYINRLNLKDDLSVTGAVVSILVGDKFDVDSKDLSINGGGNAGHLMISLYGDAEFEAKKNVDFAGLIYGPDADATVKFQKDATITGAVITNGEIDLKKNTDIIYTALVQAQIAALACPFTPPDHYELSLPTASVACVSTPVTVTACADSSNPCTNPSTSLAGQTANLVASGGTLGSAMPSFNALGVATTTLSFAAAANGTPVTVSLSGEATAAANARKCCPNGSACVTANSCSTTFSTAGFVFAGAAGGAATTIPAQTAGTTSATYYLRAVKSGTATLACEPALSGSNSVTLGYQCNNPSSCSAGNHLDVTPFNGATPQATVTVAPAGSSLTLIFDAGGNAPLNFRYRDVGQITVNASKAAGGLLLTALSGSSNAFVVKPGGFVLSNIHQTAAPATVNPGAANAAGGKFVRAGETFSATVTAVSSAGLATPNYGRETTPETVRLTSALAGGLGLSANPSISGSFGSFAGGIATGSSFAWDEVGIITLTPGVGDGNYLGAGDVIGATSGNVGRFHPAHFTVTAGTVTPACGGGFSYFGQDGVTTAFTITARNLGNVTTQNYAGSFAKLDLGSWSNFGFSSNAPAGATLAASTTLPSGTWVAGATSNLQARHKLGRPTALPAAPGFSNVIISAAPVDADGVTVAAATPVAPATPLYFGRLWLGNAYGSDRLDLTLPFEAQHWNGNAFVKNALDSGCTTIASGNVALGNKQGGLTAYSGPVAGGTTSAGAGSLTLSRPASAAAGSVDLVVSLGSSGSPSNCAGLSGATPAPLSHLSGKWCGSNHDRDPTARATFGVFGSSARKGAIYRRESF